MSRSSLSSFTPATREFLAQYARVNRVFASEAIAHMSARFQTRDGRRAILSRVPSLRDRVTIFRRMAGV